MKWFSIICAIISFMLSAYCKRSDISLIYKQIANNLWLVGVIFGILLIIGAFYKDIYSKLRCISGFLIKNLKIIIAIFLIMIGIYSLNAKVSVITAFYIILGFIILLANPNFLMQIFGNVKRLKVGDIEIELEKAIRSLKESSAMTETEEIEPLNDIKISSNQILEEYINKPNPEMAFVEMSIEIEKILRNIAANHDIRANLPMFKLIYNLLEHELIDYRTCSLIKEFWPIRNKIVHGADVNFSLDMLEIGSRILSILKNKDSGIINRE